MKTAKLLLVPCLFLTLLAAAGAQEPPAPPPEPAAESEPEPCHNTLRWSTASEVDNFGFDVYRGESKEGPFTRLTAEPIPGAGTVDEVQRYQFVDDTIEPDTEYWYYVESISMGGVREKFTPTFPSQAKRCVKKEPAAGEEPESDPENNA